jgi:hypothetical protein
MEKHTYYVGRDRCMVHIRNVCVIELSMVMALATREFERLGEALQIMDRFSTPEQDKTLTRSIVSFPIRVWTSPAAHASPDRSEEIMRAIESTLQMRDDIFPRCLCDRVGTVLVGIMRVT